MSNLQVITKSDYRNLGDLTTDQSFINLCVEIASGDVDVNRELTRLAMVSQKTNLWNCSINSIRAGVAMALGYGLEINGPAQHCFLIQYGDDAQFQMGYYGLAALAKRIPDVHLITSRMVCEKDHFDFNEGSAPFVDFKPDRFSDDRGAIRGAFSLIQIYKGKDRPMLQYVRTMSLADLYKRRDASKAYQDKEAKRKYDSPWHRWFEEQAQKSVGKRGLKECHDIWAYAGQAPIHLRSAMEIDNQAERIDYAALGKILEPALIKGIQEGTEQPPMLEDQVSSEPYSAPTNQAVPNIPEKPQRTFKLIFADTTEQEYWSIDAWQAGVRSASADETLDKIPKEHRLEHIKRLLEHNAANIKAWSKDDDEEVRKTVKRIHSGLKKKLERLADQNQIKQVRSEETPPEPPPFPIEALPQDLQEVFDTPGQTAEDAESLFSEADKLAADAIKTKNDGSPVKAKLVLEQAYAVAEAIDSKLYPEMRKNALESCNAANEVINNGK